MNTQATLESVCLKLIVKYTRQMDAQEPNEFGYKPMATYIWLRETSTKACPEVLGIFDYCFKKALKQEMIWEVRGLYTCKKPAPRTLDDEWDY